MRWIRHLSKGALWLPSVLAIAGAVVVIFGWNGVTRDLYTRTMAVEAEKELAVRLCVANFRASPNAEAQLAALTTVAAWARPRLIENGGWDRPPDSKTPIPGVAERCASQLITGDPK
jgi:hypothetical protein